MESGQDQPITVSDRELLLEIRSRLVTLDQRVQQLALAWQEYEPVVAAFKRGGLLAASRAARNGSRT